MDTDPQETTIGQNEEEQDMENGTIENNKLNEQVKQSNDEGSDGECPDSDEEQEKATTTPVVDTTNPSPQNDEEMEDGEIVDDEETAEEANYKELRALRKKDFSIWNNLAKQGNKSYDVYREDEVYDPYDEGGIDAYDGNDDYNGNGQVDYDDRMLADRRRARKGRNISRHNQVTPRERLICKFFREGHCRDMKNCVYSHNTEDSGRKNKLCRFYETGQCAQGLNCKRLHGEFPCYQHHINRACIRGDHCRFSHEPLTQLTESILKSSYTEEDLHPPPKKSRKTLLSNDGTSLVRNGKNVYDEVFENILKPELDEDVDLRVIVDQINQSLMDEEDNEDIDFRAMGIDAPVSVSIMDPVSNIPVIKPTVYNDGLFDGEYDPLVPEHENDTRTFAERMLAKALKDSDDEKINEEEEKRKTREQSFDRVSSHSRGENSRRNYDKHYQSRDYSYDSHDRSSRGGRKDDDYYGRPKEREHYPSERGYSPQSYRGGRRSSNDGRKPRDYRDPREKDYYRDSKDSRGRPSPRDHQRGSRDARDYRGSRDYRDTHDYPDERHGGRDSRDYKDPRDSRGVRDHRDVEPRSAEDYRGSEYSRDYRETKNFRVEADYKEEAAYKDTHNVYSSQSPYNNVYKESGAPLSPHPRAASLHRSLSPRRTVDSRHPDPRLSQGPKSSHDSRDPRDPRYDPRDPRYDPRDQRVESRDPRLDSRDVRPDSRDPRADPRLEGRPESRDPRLESRDSRLESRDPRLESRDPRLESRDPRIESRDPRLDNRPDSRDPRHDNRLESRDPRLDNRPESRDPRLETKDPRLGSRDSSRDPRLANRSDSQDPRLGARDPRRPVDPRLASKPASEEMVESKYGSSSSSFLEGTRSTTVSSSSSSYYNPSDSYYKGGYEATSDEHLKPVEQSFVSSTVWDPDSKPETEISSYGYIYAAKEGTTSTSSNSPYDSGYVYDPNQYLNNLPGKF